MKLTVLSAEDLRDRISMGAAIDAMKSAFAALSTGTATAPPRTHVDVAEQQGKVLLMGAALPDQGLATKIVAYFPNNPNKGVRAVNGLIVVLNPKTGMPTAICDGTYLTALRTGAGTGASIDLLARQNARVGALFGTGGQAAMQLCAMDAARSLDTIRVYSRTLERAQLFVAKWQPQVEAELVLAETPGAAVVGADIVVTSTNSHAPVFDGTALGFGVHVAAIGSITEAMHEVDGNVVARASIFVDSMAGALGEAGELIVGEKNGLTSREHWTELGLVAAGKHPGRQREEELTFFKSVGHAVQDVAISRLALEAAQRAQLGRTLEL